MSILVGGQYRPVTSNETNANASLSVRIIRDLEWGLNNYLCHVGNFPLVSQPCMPSWKSHANTTEERVVLPFADRVVPNQFDTLDFYLCHKRYVGTGNVTWRLYCHEYLYRGTVAMETAKLHPQYEVCNIVSDANSWLTPVPSSLTKVATENDKCWLVLTAEASDESTESEISAIGVIPRVNI